jgi:hypothetical protein
MEMRRQRRRARPNPPERGGRLEQSGGTRGSASRVGEPSDRVPLRTASGGERLILWMYWLVSGYGLRASRALLALLVTIALFALAFHLWANQPVWRALLTSAESTTSLFKAPEKPQLPPVGEAIQLPLRLLGPLFFGLALVSVRGRVKR